MKTTDLEKPIAAPKAETIKEFTHSKIPGGDLALYDMAKMGEPKIKNKVELIKHMEEKYPELKEDKKTKDSFNNAEWKSKSEKIKSNLLSIPINKENKTKLLEEIKDFRKHIRIIRDWWANTFYNPRVKREKEPGAVKEPKAGMFSGVQVMGKVFPGITKSEYDELEKIKKLYEPYLSLTNDIMTKMNKIK